MSNLFSTNEVYQGSTTIGPMWICLQEQTLQKLINSFTKNWLHLSIQVTYGKSSEALPPLVYWYPSQADLWIDWYLQQHCDEADKIPGSLALQIHQVCQPGPSWRQETLILIIKDNIKPGTTIRSDCWP